MKLKVSGDKVGNKDNHHSRVAYVAFIAAIFSILGFGLAFLILQHSPSFLSGDMTSLFVGGLILGALGLVVLIVSITSHSYSTMFSSRKRIKRGQTMTVYGAMSLHVYYPSWMKWWIPLIPVVFFLFLGGAKVISFTLAWILFFGYGGLLILYQYLYARRWLAKYQNNG